MLSYRRTGRIGLAVIAVVVLAWLTLPSWPLSAQQPDEPAASPSAEPLDVDVAEEPPAESAPVDESSEGIQVLELLRRGGIFMFPIYGMAILVIAITIERSLGLRRSKIMPAELIDELGRLGGSGGGFDPRKAYRICQAYPSAAATIIRAMLLKIGRPHSEVEHAVSEASDREATRLYANVRWLTLAAAVSPLLGLLGTVWGMIQAFYHTSQLQPGANKVDVLADGIYGALVTTLCGLVVAIPAAILAHFFESRVHTLFHETDEMLFNLLPQIERYEGRLRVSEQSLGEASQPPRQQPNKPVAANQGD